MNLIYKLPLYFFPCFESVGLSVQEKKFKIDFQDGGHGGHLGFQIGKILDIFDLHVALIFLTKFRVSWPFGSGEKVLGFQIRTILAISDLLVTPMPQTKFLVF